jgi:signal peptidase II
MKWFRHIHQRRFVIAVYLMAFICLCDQLSKAWIRQNVRPLHYRAVTPFLHFVLVRNTGVTFGFLNDVDQAYVTYGLIAVASIVVFFLGRWLWRTASTPVSIGLALIIGGAVGNVIDRVRFGAVIDFLDFYWEGYHWYAFNIADAAIVTGVGLLLLDSLVRGR